MIAAYKDALDDDDDNDERKIFDACKHELTNPDWILATFASMQIYIERQQERIDKLELQTTEQRELIAVNENRIRDLEHLMRDVYARIEQLEGIVQP